MKLNLPKESAYFERYGYFQGYGDGLMLVHWTGRKLEYVLFTPYESLKKEVINKGLLEEYKKEISAV
jgi:hypothetical protein